ncbi:MAG: transposase [Lentihominibacter sp.]|jgi:transposase
MTSIRNYTNDFKQDAIKYVEDHPDMPLHQIADSLGMPKDTLYGRIKTHCRKLRNGKVNPNSPLTEEEKEIARLKRETRDLQDALEVLKKAISILND